MRPTRQLYIPQAVALVWRSNPRIMTVSVVVMVVQGIVPVVPIYIVKLIVDAVAAGEGFATIAPLIIVAGAAILLTALLQSYSGYVREAQSQALSDHVQTLIHEKSLALSLAYYEGAEFFDKLHRAQQEAPYRPAQVVDNLMSIFRSAISVVGITGILIYSLPWYTVVILALSAIPPAIVRLVSSGRLFTWKMKNTPAERHVYYLNWLITGRSNAKEVRLFGLGRLLTDRAREWRDRLRTERLALIARRSTGEFLTSGLQALVVVGLLAYFAYESIQTSSSIGNLVLFFQAVQKGQQVLAELLRGTSQLYESNLFLANVFEFLKMEPDMRRIPAAEIPLRGEREGIEVDQVTFAYPHSDRNVLESVSLTVRPGEIVAIVGDNGAGKTTLIKLLCRFYDPESGSIRMNGADLRTLDEADLRGGIAVLFQDHAQYFYTATENIWFGDIRTPLDNARVQAAAAQANAHEFLSRLRDGYETTLGRWLDEGAELSGGQWRKVALARTLYRDAPVLILDEPTAGLDPDSEARFINNLRSIGNGRSLVVVSHKIASARRADRIYVMRDGRVIESGSHEELVAQRGYYAGLYETQLRQIQTEADE